MSPVNCAGATPPRPSTHPTDLSGDAGVDASVPGDAGVDWIESDGASICYQDNLGVGAAGSHVRVWRTRDPWQIQVEVGPGNCCAARGAPVMMYR